VGRGVVGLRLRDAPRGQWTVDARHGRADVRCEISNKGPSAAELAHLAAVDGPDFASVAELLRTTIPPRADAPTVVRRLTELVHRWMFSGVRGPFASSLYANPARALAVAGQGFADDVARVLAGLLGAAGLEARVFDLRHHAGVVARWDGAWHLADPCFGIVFVTADGSPATLRELAVNPDLIRRNLKRAPSGVGASRAIALYRKGLRFDDESSFQKARTELSPPRPWPLPAGAFVRFQLGGGGAREGFWRWTLPDPQGRFVTPSLAAEGWREQNGRLGIQTGSPAGIMRLPLDLPYPMTVVRARLRLADIQPTARVTVFIFGPNEGPADATCVFSGPARPELLAERRWATPLDGPAQVELRVFAPGADLAGLIVEAVFLHAPAAAPNVAGRRCTIIGEARANGPARLTTQHEWR
jgi:hypothetical protein